MGLFDFKTGMRCSKCGYKMESREAIIASTGKSLKDILGIKHAVSNSYANFVNLKCPNCGECGRWIEDK